MLNNVELGLGEAFHIQLQHSDTLPIASDVSFPEKDVFFGLVSSCSF